MQSHLVGQQIGRYLIRQRIGGGGVATVYQAYDQVSGQTVALKVLPPNPDPATLDRFRREALMAGALRHPHIVRILQVGTAEGGHAAYMAMELVEGESLADLLGRVAQLQAEESCRLLEPIARALAFAHAHGVVHRDVKPSNILLRPLGLRPGEASDAAQQPRAVNLEVLPHAVVPLLSDFGIARYLDAPELTHSGRTIGTPAFMAPEQCMGSREVDGRADIYSMGTVLYRCVTGRLPFSGSTTQILHAHVFNPVVIDEEMARTLPAGVIELLRRSLAKEPDARYPTTDAFADALAEAGGTDPTARLGVPGGVDDVHATATLALPVTRPAAQKTRGMVKVLVPGTEEIDQSAPQQCATKGTKQPRGPKWERVAWAALFLVIVLGGGLWSARSWLRVWIEPEGEGSTLSLPILVTYTPTPQGEAEVVASGDSAATVPAAVVTDTVGGSVSDPATVVAAPPTEAALVATALPSATVAELPTVVATATPTALPVEAMPEPTTVPTPTATISVSPTTASPTASPTEALVGACSSVVGEFFLSQINQLRPELQTDFACPTSPAETMQGVWLPFARGTMVAPEGAVLVYVYYDDGSWQQVSTSAPGGVDESVTSALPPPFNAIWAADGRHLLLGEPLQSEAVQQEMVIQRFVGGIALGNLGDGRTLFLSRAKLRF